MECLCQKKKNHIWPRPRSHAENLVWSLFIRLVKRAPFKLWSWSAPKNGLRYLKFDLREVSKNNSETFTYNIVIHTCIWGRAILYRLYLLTNAKKVFIKVKHRLYRLEFYLFFYTLDKLFESWQDVFLFLNRL